MATTWSEDGTEKVTENKNRGHVAFLGGKKKPKGKVYTNPGDGSVPGRYPDESLESYKNRRYDPALYN